MRIALLLFTVLVSATQARDITPYLMDPAEERRLAATAAPAAVTLDASYYRLSAEGYVLAREGSNGWHCFVERAFWTLSTSGSGEFDPRIRAPHCINAAGAEARMQELFLEAELAIAGLTRQEATLELDAAFRDGRLRPPEGLAMTYMMSPEQWLGERAGRWHPHLMFWVPYLSNGETGGNPPFGTLPFVDNSSGSRSAVLIVAVPPYSPSDD